MYELCHDDPELRWQLLMEEEEDAYYDSVSPDEDEG
jgi:hypothetical protein